MAPLPLLPLDSPPSRPPSLPLLPQRPLAHPALVEDLGGGAQLAEPQGPETQLEEVLWDLQPLGPDLFQSLEGRFGEGEVTDGGKWLHANMAPTH